MVAEEDGSATESSQVVKDFLSDGAAKRLPVERLPGYAPDLTPDEGIWNDLKRVELATVCCHDLAELTTHLHQAAQRVRAKPEVIQACSRQCAYLVEFLPTTSVGEQSRLSRWYAWCDAARCIVLLHRRHS